MAEWYEQTQRTWIDVFVQSTERFADRVFASCDGESLTYGELRRDVDRIASGLLAVGVRPGQTLAVWMTNSLAFLLCQWAAYRVGGTLLPLYSYYRVPEIRHALDDARPVVLFTKQDLAGKVDTQEVLLDLLDELGDERPDFQAAPGLQHVVTAEAWDLPGAVSLDDLRDRGTPAEERGLAFARERTSPFDVMNVMYTSGTTGVPKGGLSMHRNNMATVHLWSTEAGLGSDDVVLCHVPLFTNFGGLYASGLAMYNGARIVVTETFDAAVSLATMAAEGVTYVPGTPEMFRMLLDHEGFAATDTSTVRGAHVAGSYLEPALMERIIADLAPDAMQAYGMSECGGLSTVTSSADPDGARRHSIGRPLANSLVEIHDPDDGQPLDDGDVGEVWFADARPGSCVGKGYLGDAQATAAAITPSGWFRSGDLGRFQDGYLYFEGRLKNMITVGGFNVYPKEVERFLEDLPGVKAAHVVGVPDRRLGTVPVAFVVPPGDEPAPVDDLLAAVDQRLSSQKRPRQIWSLPEREVPLNATGKLHTARLREWAEARCAEA